MADGAFKPDASTNFGVIEDVGKGIENIGKWRRGQAIKRKGITVGTKILISKNGISTWAVTSVTEDNYLTVAFEDGRPYQGRPVDPIRAVVVD